MPTMNNAARNPGRECASAATWKRGRAQGISLWLHVAILAKHARLFFYAFNCARPVAGRGLAKETHRWIPGTIIAIEKVTPARRIRKERPSRLAHRAGEMGDPRGDGNEQIQMCNTHSGA